MVYDAFRKWEIVLSMVFSMAFDMNFVLGMYCIDDTGMAVGGLDSIAWYRKHSMIL